MNVLDSTKLGKLRLEFCRGTGFDSPFDAVQAGIKSIQDWLDVVAQFKIDNPSYAKPTTTEPLKAELSTRKEILEYLSEHSLKNKYGLSTKEIAEGLDKANNTVRDLLNDMTEEGLLVAVQILRAKHSKESKVYRIAGIDEVSA